MRDTAASEREMLYRLSLIRGIFVATKGVIVAWIKPEIPIPVDCFYCLLGPWIEVSTRISVYLRCSRTLVSTLVSTEKVEEFGLKLLEAYCSLAGI